MQRFNGRRRTCDYVPVEDIDFYNIARRHPDPTAWLNSLVEMGRNDFADKVALLRDYGRKIDLSCTTMDELDAMIDECERGGGKTSDVT